MAASGLRGDEALPDQRTVDRGPSRSSLLALFQVVADGQRAGVETLPFQVLADGEDLVFELDRKLCRSAVGCGRMAQQGLVAAGSVAGETCLATQDFDMSIEKATDRMDRASGTTASTA